MSPSLATRRPSLAAALALALYCAGAAAQIANDPTRPPAGFGAAGDGGYADDGMTLQSVMISPAQKSAIINGQVVRLGERYGDAVLVRVAESEVVLKGPSASRVLKLHPGVDRREGTAATGVPPRKGLEKRK